MAILFSDGFDYYNATSGNYNELINISSRYTSVVSTWASLFSYTTGYSGGQSIVFGASTATTNSLPIPIGNSLSSVTMGAHVYIPSLSAETDIFRINSLNGGAILLSVATTGILNVRVYGSGSAAIRPSTFAISAANWWYLELHAEVTSADQVLVTVYANNVPVFSYTGTGFSASPYFWSSFTAGKSQLGTGASYRMDNFYLSDGEILGVINISTVVPDGDTAQKDGIPVNGTTNYNMVNDISAPSMDSNILLTTDLASDYYTVGDMALTYPNDSIISVQGISYSSTDNSSSTFRSGVNLKSSSVETTDSVPIFPGNLIPLAATTNHLRTDPATSTAWTLSGVNNINLGVKRYDNYTFSSNGFYIDSAGNYPTTVSGSTIISGDTPPSVSGNALIFNGSTNIRYTDVPFWHVTMPYSVQFDFYTTNINTNQCICTVGGNVQTPGWPEWTIFIAPTTGLTLYSNSDNTSGTQISPNFITGANMANNTWYKVGFMFYAGRVRGYLNNSQVFDVALNNGSIVDSSYGFAIGGDTSKDSGRQFSGGVRNFSMANQLFWSI